MSKVSNKPKEIDESWGSSMEVLGWLNGAVSDVPSLALQITSFSPLAVGFHGDHTLYGAYSYDDGERKRLRQLKSIWR